MSIPGAEGSTLSESTTSFTGPLSRTLNSWTQQINRDRVVENEARAQIQSQVQSLIRDTPFPWTMIEWTSRSVETVVMDILQQELDGVRHSDVYRTACMKCLRALCKARKAVPSSLFLRDVTREGDNAVAGGGFADIWKGRRHDTPVCLKVLRVFGTEEPQAKVLWDFCQEALVWRQLCHPNVLPFLGVSKELFAPRYCLISPWMVNGNIVSYLRAHSDHDRLTSLVQVAEGMKYLHNLNPPIVHADIRGVNILVMDDLRCCLADFGLSLFAESQTLESSSRMKKGSIRWLAPEYIDPNVAIDPAYITARDIYAYGCTVVEIFTGEPPFSDIKNDAAVMLAVIAGKRPLRPRHLLQDNLWSLVMACLTDSPSQRPNAGQISKVLADGDLILADFLTFSDGISTHLRNGIDFINILNIPAKSDNFINGSNFRDSHSGVGRNSTVMTSILPATGNIINLPTDSVPMNNNSRLIGLNFRDFSPASALINIPTRMQLPPGFQTGVPPSSPPSSRQVFPGLNTSYNINYQGSNQLAKYQCVICNQLIWAGDIRRHLDSHPSYCKGRDAPIHDTFPEWSYPKHIKKRLVSHPSHYQGRGVIHDAFPGFRDSETQRPMNIGNRLLPCWK
ncbi:kinase-like domain-containing protein [Armillaria nabsnona]|nr:kinase-like domain-containing protein [Armillaria nabsnona]